MPDQLPPSIFPARFQILSGSMLKLLACIAMLIDHTGAIILSHYPPALTELFYINGKGITFYRIVRDIGRCAFPIFCFLIVEGFLHTHDRRKYGPKVSECSLLSSILHLSFSLLRNITLLRGISERIIGLCVVKIICTFLSEY